MREPHPARIDWQRVALNIRASGMPLSRAAKLVGCNERHINRLARGEVQQPRFDTGCRLLDLHLERCPQRHSLDQLVIR